MKSLLSIDSKKRRFSPKKIRRVSLVTLFSIVLFSVGTAFSARMVFNNGGNIEFGQGILETTTCDSNGILVTPINSFVNEDNAGSFTFNAIQVTRISANCVGKVFVIKVLDDQGDPLPITRDEEGTAFSAVEVLFNPLNPSVLVSENDGTPNTVTSSGYWENQFTLVGVSPIVVGTLSNLYEKDASVSPVPGNPAENFFELDLEENSFQITFNPSTENAAGFADARTVYHITLETKS
jgi:hypothetical protein